MDQPLFTYYVEAWVIKDYSQDIFLPYVQLQLEKVQKVDVVCVQTGLHPPAQLELLLHSKQINTLSLAHSVNQMAHELLPLNYLTPSPLPLYHIASHA